LQIKFYSEAEYLPKESEVVLLGIIFILSSSLSVVNLSGLAIGFG